MKNALHFATKLNSSYILKCIVFVRLRSQSSISRANGDLRSQIENHVVFSVRSNLPQKVQQFLSLWKLTNNIINRTY